jgi:hypothetical protein
MTWSPGRDSCRGFAVGCPPRTLYQSAGRVARGEMDLWWCARSPHPLVAGYVLPGAVLMAMAGAHLDARKPYCRAICEGFLANPDLPARYWRNAPLNALDQATFYAGEEMGYIDYPALA